MSKHLPALKTVGLRPMQKLHPTSKMSTDEFNSLIDLCSNYSDYIKLAKYSLSEFDDLDLALVLIDMALLEAKASKEDSELFQCIIKIDEMGIGKDRIKKNLPKLESYMLESFGLINPICLEHQQDIDRRRSLLSGRLKIEKFSHGCIRLGEFAKKYLNDADLAYRAGKKALKLAKQPMDYLNYIDYCVKNLNNYKKVRFYLQKAYSLAQEESANRFSPSLLGEIANFSILYLNDRQWANSLYQEAEMCCYDDDDLLHLGKNLCQFANDFTWAKNLYVKALDLNKYHPYRTISVAEKISEDLNDKEWAEQILDKIDLEDSSFYLAFSIGKAYMRISGNIDKAKRMFNIALQLEPDSSDLLMIVHYIIEYFNDKSWSLNVIEKVLEDSDYSLNKDRPLSIVGLLIDPLQEFEAAKKLLYRTLSNLDPDIQICYRAAEIAWNLRDKEILNDILKRSEETTTRMGEMISNAEARKIYFFDLNAVRRLITKAIYLWKKNEEDYTTIYNLADAIKIIESDLDDLDWAEELLILAESKNLDYAKVPDLIPIRKKTLIRNILTQLHNLQFSLHDER